MSKTFASEGSTHCQQSPGWGNWHLQDRSTVPARPCSTCWLPLSNMYAFGSPKLYVGKVGDILELAITFCQLEISSAIFIGVARTVGPQWMWSRHAVKPTTQGRQSANIVHEPPIMGFHSLNPLPTDMPYHCCRLDKQTHTVTHTHTLQSRWPDLDNGKSLDDN